MSVLHHDHQPDRSYTHQFSISDYSISQHEGSCKDKAYLFEKRRCKYHEYLRNRSIKMTSLTAVEVLFLCLMILACGADAYIRNSASRLRAISCSILNKDERALEVLRWMPLATTPNKEEVQIVAVTQIDMAAVTKGKTDSVILHCILKFISKKLLRTDK